MLSSSTHLHPCCGCFFSRLDFRCLGWPNHCNVPCEGSLRDWTKLEKRRVSDAGCISESNSLFLWVFLISCSTKRPTPTLQFSSSTEHFPSTSEVCIVTALGHNRTLVPVSISAVIFFHVPSFLSPYFRIKFWEQFSHCQSSTLRGFSKEKGGKIVPMGIDPLNVRLVNNLFASFFLTIVLHLWCTRKRSIKSSVKYAHTGEHNVR